MLFFFFSSRRRHTRWNCDWSSDVCSSDLGRSLRSNRMPFQLQIALVNPDIPRHFLNLRCEEGENGKPPLMHRMITRHTDNPSLTPEYMARLERMTGVRRRRLFKGEWCTAEGAIFPEYDKAVHMVHLRSVPFHPALHGVNTDLAIKIRGFYGAVDWGFREPGTFLVLALDSENNLYVVEQVYKTQQSINWWADLAVKLDKK